MAFTQTNRPSDGRKPSEENTFWKCCYLGVGGLNVLCSVTNYSQRRDLFPLLLLEGAKKHFGKWFSDGFELSAVIVGGKVK